MFRPKRVLKVVARSESETESVEESMEIIKAPQSSEFSECDNRSNTKEVIGWCLMQRKFANCQSFASMQAIVNTFSGPPPPLGNCEQTLKTSRSVIDEDAFRFYPNDAPCDYLPVQTYGDGNCFPRALSILLYGSQRKHLEIRGRIVYQAILEKQKFLSAEYLDFGTNHVYGRASTPEIFAQYSEHFIPETVLTPTVVERIYEAEVLEVARAGSECGIWQMFQASAALNRAIQLIYPYDVNPNLRLDFNRTIYPSSSHHQQAPITPLHVFWTYLNRDAGVPNHFVAVLRDDRQVIYIKLWLSF